jgi:hypothetical protein
MGRTLPTQVQLLQSEEEAWKPFRRALRKEDQDAFDAIWAHARFHSVPAGMAGRMFPFEAYCLAMMVGLERELIELKKRLSTT